MAIDFPSSPALNDTYTEAGKTWRWNDTGWQLVASVVTIIETAQVITADVTLSTGSNGLSVGPVEVAATYAVTVPANATWVIV
jgi:hypothetical protein